MKASRDTTLDILRGLAIFLMVQSHIASSIYAYNFPVWGNWYVAIGSFVPMLFILLAGMMVAYTTLHKGYALKHYLLRGGALLLTASLVVDMFIWGFVPFLSFEVLYLIGVSLPLTYLFLTLSERWRWGIVLGILAMTPVLQVLFGYTPYPTEISLYSGATTASGLLNTTGILQHWLIDGWFPIFPWLGIAFLGANLGVMRWKEKSLETFATRSVVLLGSTLVILGIVLWVVVPVGIYVRAGFGETIYPVTIPYLVTAVGQIVLLFAFIDWKTTPKVYKPLIVFGESSLFMYWFQFGIIQLLPIEESLTVLFVTFGFVLLGLLGLGYVLKWLRRKWPGRPAVLRYIFGI